jgi:hypothetical protein
MALKNVQPRDLSTLRSYEELKDHMTREEFDKSTKSFELIPLEGFGEGVYNCWQLEHNTSTPVIWDADLRSLVPADDWFNPYGVCDSPQQFFEKYGDILRNSERWFCTNFSIITKADQPEHGGWRWHKWGPYIGSGTPTTEYLHDEPAFEEVWIYHVFEIPSPANPQPMSIFDAMNSESEIAGTKRRIKA